MVVPYITSKDWDERIGDIPLVGFKGYEKKLIAVLFGSTHVKARWRYDSKFIRALGEYARFSYTPQMDNWDPAYAQVEATAKHLAAVVVVRLENHDVELGSMGSMAEIGSAILTGMFKGYKVIISFEEGLIESLDEDPSATQIYHNMVKQLYALKETFAGEFFEFHYGNDLGELGGMVVDAMDSQANSPMRPLSEEIIGTQLNLRNQRMRDLESILLTGSAGSYAPTEPFARYRHLLNQAVSQVWDSALVRDTYSGWISDMWDDIYHGHLLAEQQVVLLKLANDTEQAHKRINTFLVTSILNQAGSMGASAEIFFNIIWALINGQGMAVYIEEYDAVDNFVEKWLNKHTEDLTDTYSDLDWNKIRSTNRLKNTDIFRSIDATRRVRAIVTAHMKMLVSDPEMSALIFVALFNDNHFGVDGVRDAFINEVCGVPGLV